MGLASGIRLISQERQHTASQKLATHRKYFHLAAQYFRHLVGFKQFGSRMALLVDDDNPQKPSQLTPIHLTPGQPAHELRGTDLRRNDLRENNGDDPLPNSEVEDFFVKMNRDFRRPKPSQEAVAAALHAIQTLATQAAERDGEAAALQNISAEDSRTEDPGESCLKCRAVNSGSNRFCGYCGATLLRRHTPSAQTATPPKSQVSEQQVRQQPAREQHIHHHHHHYFPASVGQPSAGETGAALTGEVAASEPIDAETAETAIQKLVRDWMLCCNSKRLDDLLALYSADAIVLRSNVGPAHGRSAIRQLLRAALQSGLGDIELDAADAGVLGDIACLTGRSRMLVPTAPGERHEETGKFLIVARREAGEWKILADSWCVDSPPSLPAPPTAPAPTVRPPRSR
jgi:uncharacterized protein (TIGR02246 family)